MTSLKLLISSLIEASNMVLLLNTKDDFLFFFPSIFSLLGETVVNVLDFKKDARLWHGMFAVSYSELRLSV